MIEQYQGCLIGLAVGDALGAPVEFLSLPEIIERYGEKGVTGFEPWGGFKPGTYTDDTQMSLATAAGVIRAYQRWKDRGICYPAAVVYRRYLEWLETQNDSRQRRAPGNTCLSALAGGKMGTLEEKINDSKGCGAVMRTAPVGLAFPPGRAFQQGMEYAALTHGHPSGYLPAGFLADMIARTIAGKTLAEAVKESRGELAKYEGHGETAEKISLAQKLTGRSFSVNESIRQIGAGWVGEEALAIAVYCCLKFPGDWAAGVLASVNHSGDSDSTGSITGAVLGALLGIRAIPEQWIRRLENAAVIYKLAGDMYKIFVQNKPLPFEEYPPN